MVPDNIKNTNIKNYENFVSNALDFISDRLETYASDISETPGALSISLEGVGEYLFNRQPASLQLWGSSPLSGPCRFDLVEDRWIHSKRKIDLNKYIDEEIEGIMK